MIKRPPPVVLATTPPLVLRRRAQGALILVQVLFGSGALVGALGLPATHPLVFALWRELGAGLILLLMAVYTLPQQQSPQSTAASSRWTYPLTAWTVHRRTLAWLGLFVFGNQAGFLIGLSLAGPVTASVWQPSQPIMTAAICMLAGWETVQTKRVFGIAVAFVGCIVMVVLKQRNTATAAVDADAVTTLSTISATSATSSALATQLEMDQQYDNSDASSSVSRYLAGNLFLFGNCLCTALYVIVSKRMLTVYPALLVTAWSYNMATLFMFVTTIVTTSWPTAHTFLCPTCPPLDQASPWRIPTAAWPALLYYILLGSVASYGLLTWANQYATGTLVMSFTVLQPAVAALLTTAVLTSHMIPECRGTETNDSLSPSSPLPPSTTITTPHACLDYPSWGTFCGMAGVLLGLVLIVTTEATATSTIGGSDVLHKANREKSGGTTIFTRGDTELVWLVHREESLSSPA